MSARTVRTIRDKNVELRPVVSLGWLPALETGKAAAIVVILAAWFVGSLFPLNHTDLWGHLAFGRWIVEHGRLPQADPFRSFLLPDAPFANIPWLAQVLGYVVYGLFGPMGLRAGHALLVALTTGLLIAAVRVGGGRWGTAAAAGGAFVLMSLPVIGTIRPQLFGMVGTAATLLAVESLRRSNRPLFWLPLLFMLWANLHGSFPIGLGVLGAACWAQAVAWFVRTRVANEKSTPHGDTLNRTVLLRRYAIAGLTCGAAVCCHPMGVSIWPTVLGFGQNRNLAAIAEWQPLSIASFSGIAFVISVLLSVMSVIGAAAARRSDSRRPVRIGRCLPPARYLWMLPVLGLATVSALRMYAWWTLVWPVAIAFVWEACGSRSGNTPKAQSASAARTSKGRGWAVVAVSVVVVALWSPVTRTLWTSAEPKAVFSKNTPLRVGKFVSDRELRGRFFAPVDWADYLLWICHGRMEPLVHSHVHMTPEPLWLAYLALERGDPGCEAALESYRVRYVVLDLARHRRLADRLLGLPSGRWRVVYRDEQALVLGKRNAVDETP
ncbi:hypothetical protein JCM19992_07850 [Thermostilla marina]